MSSEEDIDIIEKESDDLFLDLIKERPCIYNKRLADHSNKLMIENSFEEIAHIMQDTVGNCEKRWTRLQQTFIREKSARDMESRSGAGPSNRRTWPFFDRMKTMLSNSVSRPSHSHLSSENSSSQKYMKTNFMTKKARINPIESALNNIHETVHKVVGTLNQNQDRQTSKEEEKNTDYYFGKLLAEELNSLSPRSLKKRRKKILQCLIEDSDDEN